MAEKNSLWKNIRNKAKQNKRTGATPKEPTKEMLDQEKKIKASYAVGGTIGEDGDGKPLKKDSTLSNIYNKYPAFRNMGNVTLKADTGFTKENTGIGEIEYFSPTQDTITYPTKYKYPHPNLGTHGIVYNPNINNVEEAVRLDLLHGMPISDKVYAKHRDEFGKSFKKENQEDIDYWWNKDKEEYGDLDGKESYEKNYIDGIARGLLLQGKPEDMGYSTEANKYYLQSPEISKRKKQLENYLKTGKGYVLPEVEIFSDQSLAKGGYMYAKGGTIGEEGIPYRPLAMPMENYQPEVENSFDFRSTLKKARSNKINLGLQEYDGRNDRRLEFNPYLNVITPTPNTYVYSGGVDADLNLLNKNNNRLSLTGGLGTGIVKHPGGSEYIGVEPSVGLSFTRKFNNGGTIGGFNMAHPRNLARAKTALNKAKGMVAAEVLPEVVNAYGGYIYADGGPLKKDLYDNPIESKIVNDPTSDRSYYDTRLDQIMLGTDYDQMDDYSRERLLAHENFHGKQFKKGYSTLLPTRTTYKEPSMVSNDETYYTYHNRQRTEIKKLNSDFKKENNSFNFVPDDIVFDKVTDTAQYYDPTTIEGEAKFYEDLGADISEENKNNTEYKYGGTMKKRFKKRLAIGGMLPDQDASNAQALGQFAQLQAIQDTGQGMVQNWSDNYLSDRGFDQGEIDIVNKTGGRDLAKIPGVAMAVGTFNAVTGRTKDALADYRLNKQKDETQRANDFNDYSGYAQDAQVTFAQGGDISMLEGPSHAEGGIQLTNNAEVEGGEVKADDFILSDRLGDKNGTFAEQMKKEIKKGSPLRDSQNDTYSKFRIMNKKNKLVAMNKAALSDMENIMMAEASGESPQAMFAMGGYLKRKKMMYNGGNMPGPGKKKLINPLDYPNLFTPYESPVIPDDLKKEDAIMVDLLDAEEYATAPEVVKRTNNAWGWRQPLPEDRANLIKEYEDYRLEKGLSTTNTTVNNVQTTPSETFGPNPNYAKFDNQTDIANIEDLPGYAPEVNLNPIEAGLSSGPPVSNLDVYQEPKFAFSQAAPDYFQTLPKKTPVETGGLKGGVQPMPIVQAPSITQDTGTDAPNSKFGMDAMDYGSIAAGAAGGLSQLYYGLKGPDEVRDAKLNLARASKINLTRAKRLASQEIDSSFNLLDQDLAQTAASAGNYASNRLASAIKRARTKAENNARLSESEETQNVGIQNQLNQYNSQVLNQQEQLNLGQEDKRVQEKDSARMAVTEGFNNIGQSVGQGNRDRRAYAWQDELANEWMGTDNFVTDSEGNRFFVNKDGKLVRKNKKTNTK